MDHSIQVRKHSPQNEQEAQRSTFKDCLLCRGRGRTHHLTLSEAVSAVMKA